MNNDGVTSASSAVPVTGHNEMEGMKEPASHVVGDLLWSKISGHPFWPCMVTYDPLEGCFMQKRSARGRTYTIYHVQYFGEAAQRGWTTLGGILPFEGFAEFTNKMKIMKATALKSEQKKMDAKFSITPSKQRIRQFAIDEAELALPMTRVKRLEAFTFHYKDSPKKSHFENGNALLVPCANGISGVSHSNGSVLDAIENSKELKFGKDVKKIAYPIQVELLCQICEKTGATVTCTGICTQSYHLNCLGVMVVPQDFKCAECTSGNHSCFICKRFDTSVKKCSKNDCKKFYHSECLKNFPCAKVDCHICPLHKCATCYNDNPKNPLPFKARLVRCFRCPFAYHSRDGCVAAGSETLAPGIVLCPDHFTPRKGRQYQTVCNISWCDHCGSGGDLILCDRCPKSYHCSCLGIEAPQGDFFCPDCVARKHLCYEMLIWVKIGVFRWWPAKIKDPRDIPMNILNIPHYVGEFPIQYYGTQEYFWTHRGRVFPFTLDDVHTQRETAAHSNKKSTLHNNYVKSLHEAVIAIKEWDEKKNSEKSSYKKPPPYKHIKVNRPVGKVQILTLDPSTLVHCACDTDDENPCGYNSLCLNRSMLYECHPSVCKTGNLCQNQKFQKREYVSAIPFKSKHCGWGLKTCQDVKKGEFVSEYVGDLVDEEECRRRIKEKQAENDLNFYFLTLDKDRIIDAGPRGNLSRFMNHSCTPNCETQKWIVNGDIRIGLFAICDIASGSELTFDYRMDSLDYEKQKCFCGSEKCSGAIGEKQQNGIKSTKVRGKKRKRKRRNQPMEDSICYRCKDSGTLVMCDRRDCLKAYHIECLRKDSVPIGQWICPWHCCDVCGKSSKYLCSECPNSFCERHRTTENLVVLPSGLLLCDEHEDHTVSNI